MQGSSFSSPVAFRDCFLCRPSERVLLSTSNTAFCSSSDVAVAKLVIYEDAFGMSRNYRIWLPRQAIPVSACNGAKILCLV